MRSSLPFLILGFGLALLPPGSAQVPNTLRHSFFSPATELQTSARLGASVAVEGNYTVVGAPLDDRKEIDAGLVKVFNTNTGSLLHVIANPTHRAGDQFGASVAISGSRLVVGTPSDHGSGTNAGTAYHGSGTNAGTAYVYDLSSATPTQPVVTFFHWGAGPAQNVFLGCSVAIAGTNVIVGTKIGISYLYDLTRADPRLPTFRFSPGLEPDDDFGEMVAISSTHAAISAPGRGAGSLYVYALSNPSSAPSEFTVPGAAPSELFGSSFAMSGTRIVVGAEGYDIAADHDGSAYVFDLTSATPHTPVAMLSNPTPEANDRFGAAVAMVGSRVIVGAPQDDTGIGNAGSAYVYDLNSPTPSVPWATLHNPAPAANDSFGSAVAISSTHMVAGAPDDDTSATDAGSAYIYDAASPTTPPTTLHDPGLNPLRYFGSSTVIAGTLLAVGAYGPDRVGSVQVHDLASTTPATPLATIINPEPAPDDRFGGSLGLSGQWLVVAASGDDHGAPNAGSVYVYDLASATPTVPVFSLRNPNATSGAFGSSVAISGTRVVVGANLAAC